MELSSICQKKYQIKISDVDFTKALKMSALFNFFQDIASIDADNLGIGINTLEDKYGVTWIITCQGFKWKYYCLGCFHVDAS
jgi:hypothetical protein